MHEDPLYFEENQLTDGTNYYAIGDLNTKKLTFYNSDGKSVFKSDEILNLVKGKEPSTVDILTEGRIFKAYPDDRYRISDPVPSFSFDNEYDDSVMAMEYFCGQIKSRSWIDAHSGSVVCDTSLWAGGQVEEFKEPTGIIEGLNKHKIAKILSKTQASIKPVQTEKGMKKITPKLEFLTRYMGVCGSDKPELNRFSKLWKEPPIRTDYYDPSKLYRSCGGQFPSTTIDPDENDAYTDNSSLATILNIVELQEAERKVGTGTEITPIFIGAQPGGQGKSTFCRNLAIRDEFFTALSDYPANDRSLIYATSGKVIVDLDELCGIDEDKSLLNRVKADISRQVIHVDLKYIESDDYTKRFFYTGTTNNYVPLTEDNRRWFPIEFKDLDNRFVSRYVIVPPERMCGIYWVAKHEYYDKGVRAMDIVKEVESLSSKARDIALDDPLAVSVISEYLSDNAPNPGE